MKTRIAIMAFAVILAFGMYVPASFGYSVEVGDWIKYENSYGNLTGEMEVWASDTHYGTYSYMYNTFCLEISESMSYGSSYYVNDISDSAVLGGTDGDGGATPGRDPISVGTAYLYYNFYMGTLAGYNFIDPTTRTTSADALQIAIWYLENEITSYSTGWHNYGGYYYVTDTVRDLAQSFLDAAAASGWTDIGTVRAVNIVNSYGQYRQSSLIAERVVTPEPLTVSLLGLGILGLGLMRRRMHR